MLYARARMLSFFLIVLISFVYSKAQDISNNYSFRHIESDNGLASNVIRTVLQDSRGFIWIGTSAGLSRFDGYTIENYYNDKNNPNSLIDNDIYCLIETRDKNLWIGTQNQGISVLNPATEKFTNYSRKSTGNNTIAGNTIAFIFQDDRGIIWIGTHANGITQFEPEKNQFTAIDLQKFLSPTDNIRLISSVVQDKDRIIWLASTSTILVYYDPVKDEFHGIPIPGFEGKTGNGNRTRLFVDSEDKIWIGNSGLGLYFYDKEAQKFTHFPVNSNGTGINYTHIMHFSEPEKGKIWIAIDHGGINIYDKATGKFQYIRSNSNNPRGLSADNVYTVYPDRQGNIWSGIYENGIDIYIPSKHLFRNYLQLNECNTCLTYRNVFSLSTDPEGKIWIGTDGGGINLLNPENGIIKPFRWRDNPKSVLNDMYITAIYADWQNRIWVSAYGKGVEVYDPGKQTVKSILRLDDGVVGSVNYFLQTDTNSLWYSTIGLGVSKIDLRDFSFRHYATKKDDPKTIASSFVSCIARQKSGILWFAGINGLSMYNPHDSTFTLNSSLVPSQVKLANDNVSTLFVDHSDRLWIGTLSGINVFDLSLKKTLTYTTNDGLPSNFITDIIGDNTGTIWISSPKGIARFDSVSQRFIKYDKEDGIVSNRFNIVSSTLGKDGRIYFGGVDGITSFMPQDLQFSKTVPKLVFTDLRLFNKTVQPGVKGSPLKKVITQTEAIKLGYKDYIISIEFAALDFMNPSKILYQYKLEDFDKGWNIVTADHRMITYTNLPGGSYHFKVKSTDIDGIWCDNEINLDIHISPPFWKSWWFAALAVLVILSAIYGLIRFRMAQINKQKRQLEILVDKRTKELQKTNNEITERNEEILQQNDQIAKQAAELEMHRNQLEKLVEERTADLLQAKEKAEESDRLKSSFLANMSHEIRTPMNAITGFLSMLDDEDLSEKERREFKGIIQNNSQMLLHLINDLIDLAFIESGQMKVGLSEIKLPVLIRSIYQNYENSILLKSKKKIKMKLSIADWNTFIYTDQVRFAQVLSNLIENAIKYTEEGWIEVGFYTCDSTAFIYVKDTGIGIPEDKQKLIFERFTKIEDDIGKVYRGAGLGLAISKRLVDMMNGRIWVESEEGNGSVFIFTQPVWITPYEERQVEPVIRDEETRVTLNNKVILICEDEESNYLYLKYILRKEKLTILWARNGEEALEILKAGEHPDLILMDIKMPVMNGIEATEILKKEMGFRNPIIAQTALATPDEVKSYSKYFNAFLTKPILREELFRQLNHFLINS